MSKKIGRNDPCWCGSGRKYKTCHEAFDMKIRGFENQGCIVPPHEIIKTPAQIEKIKENVPEDIIAHDIKMRKASEIIYTTGVALDEPEDKPEESAAEEKPAKKAAAKKTAKKAEDETEAEEKPAKKPAAKKTVKKAEEKPEEKTEE